MNKNTFCAGDLIIDLKAAENNDPDIYGIFIAYENDDKYSSGDATLIYWLNCGQILRLYDDNTFVKVKNHAA